MTLGVDEQRLAIQKFGVGQSVPRNEDPVLVRGAGAYSDDVNLDGQLYAAVVRSPHAHGVLNGIDLTAARQMPGVVGAWTGADLMAAGFGTTSAMAAVNNRDGSPMIKPPRPPLALDKVRFVGDPVAFVVAETLAQAEDAAEAVVLDIEPLDAVVDCQAAVQPGAPQLYDEAPHNIVADYHSGDTAAVAVAFAKAAHVTRLHLVNTRVVINPMEPRAAVAAYDAADGRYTLYAPTQSVVGMRGNTAKMIGVAPDKVRIVARNVGGSFGMKSFFPEYACLLHATKQLNRPVKWTDTRSGAFVSDHHGRDHEVDAELALDAEGHFLALRLKAFGNLGGYLTGFGAMIATAGIVRNIQSVYRTPLIELDSVCCVTNTTPITAYRGAGRPEANYFMERLVDTAAAEMGLDRVELRRRNHIRPDEMPYKTGVGTTYDSGDFSGLLDQALAVADQAGFEARRRDSAARGKLRGFGIGQYLEVTAPPTNELGAIRFEADGTVLLLTGTHDHGQGHWTPFAQIVSEKLGVPFDAIRLMQTDSDRLHKGGGTGGSKSLIASGTAFVQASQQVIDKGKRAAGHLLEAGVGDIEFADGRFTIVGTDRSIGIMELARSIAAAAALPDDVPNSLDAETFLDQPAAPTFPNGCHICEVEIDRDTGVAEVVRYTAVNDTGVVVNPMIVEGQMHGGVVQGIGQCLLEHTFYTDDGQLTSGTFMDYAMPRADNAPFFTAADHPTRATTNPLGAKGCGEAGCAGSMSSVMNAVVDALSTIGIRHLDMPATPQRVWSAMEAASFRQAAE